jgi:hypothetical protein
MGDQFARSPTAEATGLNPVQRAFESRRPHQIIMRA